jgi:hypothetical protein
LVPLAYSTTTRIFRSLGRKRMFEGMAVMAMRLR